MPKHTEIDNILCRGLDGHTGVRERLCAALMANLGGYASVQPQAPRGGPDGGKDIVAQNLRGELSIGAVGFKNGVCDSSDDRRSILAKALDDLKKASPLGCREFIFFTNVNLSLGQKEKLSQTGHALGIDKIEVVDRERMIAELRRPCNFPARLDYLEIPMSNEEQASFFDYIQSDTRDRVSRVQQDIDLIKTISLLNRPVSTMSVIARFHEHRKDAAEIVAGLAIQLTADVGDQQISYHAEFVRSDLSEVDGGIMTAWWDYTSASTRELHEPVSFKPENREEHTKASRINPGEGGYRIYQDDGDLVAFLTSDFNRSMIWRPRLEVRHMDLAMILVRGTPELMAALKSVTILTDDSEIFYLEPSDYYYKNKSSGLSSLNQEEEKQATSHVIMLADEIASLHRVDFSNSPPRPVHDGLRTGHLTSVAGGSDLGEIALALGRKPLTLAEVMNDSQRGSK